MTADEKAKKEAEEKRLAQGKADLSNSALGMDEKTEGQNYDETKSVIDNIYYVNTHDNRSVTNDGIDIPGATSFETIIDIPNFSIKDFVDLRLDFLRRTHDSKFGDPGFFFFRLFFDFDTSSGLFGGILENTDKKQNKQTNSACQYLSNVIYGGRFGEVQDTSSFTYKLAVKREQLKSFAKTLRFISINCPWFFNNVSGVKNAMNYNFANPTEDDKTLTISCNQDAVDMRISTMFDLYKAACYDIVNQREIIPENLRKFNMSVVMFNPPTNGLNMRTNFISTNHTGEITPAEKKPNTGAHPSPNYEYGNMIDAVQYFNDEDISDKVPYMSFKMIKFINCEFDINELSTIPEEMTSGESFTNNIDIVVRYDRAYEYTYNKELGIFIGPDQYAFKGKIDASEKLEDV